MFSTACKKYLSTGPLSITALVIVVCVGLIVYAETSRGVKGAYGLAEDFPRGALVYAQFRDLPALIKGWDESSLKQSYLSSTNYKQFQHRHLALKLIERLDEFNDALGFPLDAASLSGAVDSSASLAIYDIGRLEIVFIAPVSEERAAATIFFQGKEGFEETVLPDGTTYYRQEVEANRGREKQQLVFAALKGRFILATTERLLLRALSNINGQTKNDSLSLDPSFRTLSAQVKPHFATLWLDQAKLNEDWYFKRYWLMQNVDELKGIRACMLDLEMQEGKWIERRDFLMVTGDARQTTGIPVEDAVRMRAMMPDDAPYFKLEAIKDDPALAASLVYDTLLDRLPQEQAEGNEEWSWETYSDYDFYTPVVDEDSSYDRYSYLSEDYDSTIDDPHDARVVEREEPHGNPLRSESENRFRASLQQSIGLAHPVAAATMSSPRTVVGPVFVEFRRVAILTLQSPANLRREALENGISEAAQSRLVVAGGTSADLKWVSHDENDQSWRELELPVLGLRLCYALRDRELFLANSPDLLKAVLAGQGKKPTVAEMEAGASLDDLTVIRLDQRKQAFDGILGRLDDERIKARKIARNQSNDGSDVGSQEFFSGNISSLLDAASDVSRIEIKRSSTSNRLHEEINYVLK